MATSRPKHNRQSILQLKEMAHVQEALVASAEAQQRAGYAFDIFRPIRETPLSVFFDRTHPNGFEEGRLNPNLPTIWKHRYGIRIGDEAKGNMRIAGKELRETVSVPNSLSALKIADEILEGAEPWSDWKQYSRLIDMDSPKVNVPITKYTDTVGGSPTDQKGLIIYKEAGGVPPAIGGKIETVELDTSGTNNSFRGTISVNRNDVKDNNFLSVEQSLKNAGNEFYFMIGKEIIDTLVSQTTGPSNTATKAALHNDTPVQKELEALVEVIRSRFPGTLRNRADTMFMNPSDAALTVKTASTGGFYPFFNRFELGPTDDTDVINNSGLAQSLGLRAVWETPQIEAGTVMITKRDIALVTGLREDLTIENFDLSVGGLYQSDLVVRIDIKQAHPEGAFKITSYEVT
jgi:hypothetical protein